MFNLLLNILGTYQAVLCQGRNSCETEFGNKNHQSSHNNFPENSHNHIWGCKSGWHIQRDSRGKNRKKQLWSSGKILFWMINRNIYNFELVQFQTGEDFWSGPEDNIWAGPCNEGCTESNSSHFIHKKKHCKTSFDTLNYIWQIQKDFVLMSTYN